jgi:hypothetical protein
MMIAESIREGITISHRNWQVMLIRLVAAIIHIFVLLVFVGIPVFIAVASFGIDLALTKEVLPELLYNPSEILSKYLGLSILLLLSLTVYLTVASVISLYTFGGIIGVLRNAALNSQYRISLASFFTEARSLFFPLLWLLSVVLLVFNALIIVFGVLIGIFIFATQSFGNTESSFSVFLSIFSGLILFLLFLIGFLGGLIYSVYAIMALVVEGRGVFDSLKRAWSFIVNKPSSILFYIILVLGMLGINIIIMLIGGTLGMIPAAGLFLSIPYQFVYYAVQTYLGIVLWSSLLVYYIKGIHEPVNDSSFNI